MPIPTDTALRGRARKLVETMYSRERWIYAIPQDLGDKYAQAIVEGAGFTCQERDASGVARFVNSTENASITTFSSKELEVMLIEASGVASAEVLGKVLDKTGFYAQSQLLRTALDVRDDEAPKALRTLAHTVVAWDEDWSDLFLLHLASPDPIVRHEAAIALSVATMVARDPGPAKALLDEAERREKYPKLKETLNEARRLIDAMSGGPVEAKHDP